MARLPQQAASIQIGGGGVPQTSGAQAAGSGLSAVGRGLQSLAGDMAQFMKATEGQESTTAANQLASEKILDFQRESALMREGATDAQQLFTDTDQLLKKFGSLTPEERNALGPKGEEIFSAIIRGQVPHVAEGAWKFQQEFRVKTLRANAMAAIDTQVRDIAADVAGRRTRLAQFNTFIDNLSPDLFPEKETLRQDAIGRAQVGIALDEAHHLPSEAQEKLRNPNGYAIEGVGNGLLRLSPEQRERVQTEIDQAVTRGNTQRATQDAQEKVIVAEERRLAKNQILGLIFTGGDWQSAMSMMYAPPGSGMMSPPAILSDDVIELTKFAEWVAEQRAKGGVENIAAETKLLIQVDDGTLTQASEIMGRPDINFSQKLRVYERLVNRQEKRKEEGRSQFEEKVRVGKAFIRGKFGAMPSLLSSVDPEAQSILADFIISYDAQMEQAYERIQAEHPDRGASFVSALAAINAQEAAVKFVRDKLTLPGVVSSRLNIKATALMGMLSPYLNEPDFNRAVTRDLGIGKLTGTDAELFFLARAEAKRQGWTDNDLRAGHKLSEIGASGQPTKTGGALKQFLREVIAGIMGVFDETEEKP